MIRSTSSSAGLLGTTSRGGRRQGLLGILLLGRTFAMLQARMISR
jgi:hypothetical protein